MTGSKGMTIVEKVRGGEQQCSTVRAGGELEMVETKRERGGREEGRVRGHERWCVVAKQRLITKSPSILLVLPCPPSRPELHTHSHLRSSNRVKICSLLLKPMKGRS